MEGIDVHGSKGAIDWLAVRGSGVRFAFVKASEGRTFVDGRIGANLRLATAARVLVGPYHYARPDLSGGLSRAVDEAEFFCALIRRSGYDKNKHARPVLDIEVGSGNLTDWAVTFCKRVESILGVKPIIYSYTYFIRAHLTGRALAEFPLWLANYSSNDGERHYVAPGEGPWRNWVVHQYTSNGRTPGVSGRCDRNYAPVLDPLYAVDPEDKEPPRTDTKAMWLWIQWRRGHGVFKAFGPRNPAVRPNVPKRIPAAWWARLILNIFGRRTGGGSRVQ